VARNDYYVEALAADRLKKCYELAPPRVRQYLEAEVQHVVDRITPGDVVLDLGCGYGRTLGAFAARAGFAIGIDSSTASLLLGAHALRTAENVALAAMNAASLAFTDAVFDLTICIQNGISAFHVDRRALIRECARVTKPGGVMLFSSYSPRFWDDRLEWFELQAAHGLLGAIDHDRTRDGVIVCKDGFRAETVGPDEFQSLCANVHLDATIEEIDASSLFCEVRLRSHSERRMSS